MGQTSVQSKKSGKKGSRGSKIEEAAHLAAEEAISELENDGQLSFEDDGVSGESFTTSFMDQAQAASAVDVFEEAFKKALHLNDAPRYHIKKNSQFLTVKDYPYSWEKLQSDYGPGYYQVIAKRRSNGQLLKMQTEMVGDPNEGRADVESSNVITESQEDKNIQMLAFLQSQQERAEARARESAKSSESGLAAVLQAITASTQKSTELMMTMFIEQSKQAQNMMMAMMNQNNQPKSDPLIPLLTTILSKPQDTGLKPLEVFKMVKDAERDAREQANRQNDLIDKRAKELAEVMSENNAGEGEEKEESLTKTLVKGFLPVLSQIMAQQQGQAQQQVTGLENARLQGATFEEGGEPKKMITGGQRPQGPAQRQTVTAQPRVETPQAVNAKVQILDARQKEAVFNFVGGDIGQAMMVGASASITAEEVLKKLEIQGLSRQTVGRSYTVEDFYGFAQRYVPEESMDAAKAWLKEFFDALQLPSSQTPSGDAKAVKEGQESSGVSRRNSPDRQSANGAIRSGRQAADSAANAAHADANGANGAKPSVAPSGNKTAVTRTRAPVREPATSI